MCTSIAAVNALNFDVARSKSLISVPRPGPNSTRENLDGFPSASHVEAHQTPTSSPNTWLRAIPYERMSGWS